MTSVQMHVFRAHGDEGEVGLEYNRDGLFKHLVNAVATETSYHDSWPEALQMVESFRKGLLYDFPNWTHTITQLFDHTTGGGGSYVAFNERNEFWYQVVIDQPLRPYRRGYVIHLIEEDV